MKVRYLKYRPHWSTTTHLYGVHGTVSLKRGPFWMVRFLGDRTWRP